MNELSMAANTSPDHLAASPPIFENLFAIGMYNLIILEKMWNTANILFNDF